MPWSLYEYPLWNYSMIDHVTRACTSKVFFYGKKAILYEKTYKILTKASIAIKVDE